MFAIINPETKEVLEFPVAQIRKKYPNISFPKVPTKYNLPSYIVQVKIETKPQVNLFEKLVSNTPTFNTSTKEWVSGWSVVGMDLAEQQAQMNVLKGEVTLKAQERLEEFAQQKGYDSIIYACSYISSSNTTFASEAQLASDVRDNMWMVLSTKLKEIEDGTSALPTTYEELYSIIPTPTWT